ncbi:hypothetical protein HPY23_13410 [Methylobacterium sp. IF7SW-B2]|nr:hypothetical protein [Methylobacterium ajmalii]MBK3406769.1 hypothetical protein [Methylobacterium ajmalii]
MSLDGLDGRAGMDRGGLLDLGDVPNLGDTLDLGNVLRRYGIRLGRGGGYRGRGDLGHQVGDGRGHRRLRHGGLDRLGLRLRQGTVVLLFGGRKRVGPIVLQQAVEGVDRARRQGAQMRDVDRHQDGGVGHVERHGRRGRGVHRLDDKVGHRRQRFGHRRDAPGRRFGQGTEQGCGTEQGGWTKDDGPDDRRLDLRAFEPRRLDRDRRGDEAGGHRRDAGEVRDRRGPGGRIQGVEVRGGLRGRGDDRLGHRHRLGLRVADRGRRRGLGRGGLLGGMAQQVVGRAGEAHAGGQHEGLAPDRDCGGRRGRFRLDPGGLRVGLRRLGSRELGGGAGFGLGLRGTLGLLPLANGLLAPALAHLQDVVGRAGEAHAGLGCALRHRPCPRLGLGGRVRLGVPAAGAGQHGPGRTRGRDRHGPAAIGNEGRIGRPGRGAARGRRLGRDHHGRGRQALRLVGKEGLDRRWRGRRHDGVGGPQRSGGPGRHLGRRRGAVAVALLLADLCRTGCDGSRRLGRDGGGRRDPGFWRKSLGRKSFDLRREGRRRPRRPGRGMGRRGERALAPRLGRGGRNRAGLGRRRAHERVGHPARGGAPAQGVVALGRRGRRGETAGEDRPQVHHGLRQDAERASPVLGRAQMVAHPLGRTRRGVGEGWPSRLSHDADLSVGGPRPHRMGPVSHGIVNAGLGTGPRVPGRGPAR